MKLESHPHFHALSTAIDYVVENYTRQPSLERMASIAGMEATAFQKTFTDWVGVSPKRFVQVFTRQHALTLLKAGESSFQTMLQTGLSSASRLHDLMIATDGLSPAQMRTLGAGTTIVWGVVDTHLGATFAACVLENENSSNGESGENGQVKALTRLEFGDESTLAQQGLSKLQKDWPAATLQRCEAAVKATALLAVNDSTHAAVPLHIRGTGFQIHVWQALLRIPSGSGVSYGAIAAALGKPKASRAVGTAVGDNPVSVLIPCHRVIQRSGALGGYAWGLSRKALILGREWGAAETTNFAYSKQLTLD
jgi:AraC family transcriptional regulator, regulatory protein of adaptative response / methylated-DNA-[protein]-cysteine methyltransferase